MRLRKEEALFGAYIFIHFKTEKAVSKTLNIKAEISKRLLEKKNWKLKALHIDILYYNIVVKNWVTLYLEWKQTNI